MGTRDRGAKALTLGVSCFGLFMIQLDLTIVNVALGDIQRWFHPAAKAWTTRPTAPPPSTSHAEFTLNRKSRTSATTAMAAANGSTIVARLSCHVTPAISARDATFTPSSRLERTGECLRRGMKGP